MTDRTIKAIDKLLLHALERLTELEGKADRLDQTEAELHKLNRRVNDIEQKLKRGDTPAPKETTVLKYPLGDKHLPAERYYEDRREELRDEMNREESRCTSQITGDAG